jgi:hypothetical protein
MKYSNSNCRKRKAGFLYDEISGTAAVIRDTIKGGIKSGV